MHYLQMIIGIIRNNYNYTKHSSIVAYICKESLIEGSDSIKHSRCFSHEHNKYVIPLKEDCSLNVPA